MSTNHTSPRDGNIPGSMEMRQSSPPADTAVTLPPPIDGITMSPPKSSPPQPYVQPPQPVASSSRLTSPSDPSPSEKPKPTPRTEKLISAHLVKHPEHTAERAIRTVFPNPNPFVRLVRRFKLKHSIINGLSKRETQRLEAQGPILRRKAGWRTAAEEGHGVLVGDLFWKMYLSVLPTLERDPLSGLCPPDLLGSTSTMPLSIISLIPDIMQHYHDVIIRAEKEVFLATNYWQPSNSVKTISGSLRELSARVLKENRPKVVVKIMYDRGTWEQLWNAHAPVKEETFEPLKIPALDEIQGLHLEVVNFHRVLLGTFHAKFLLVDRKVALINSNNIQDRPNLELMTHLEGPVVDSFYEVALQSWNNRLSPSLPCLATPYEPPRKVSNGEEQYLFQEHNPYFDDIEILKAARAARLLLRRQTLDMNEEGGRDRFRYAVRKVVDQQRQSLADWRPGEALDAKAQIAIKEIREIRERLGMSVTGMGERMMGSRPASRGPSRRPSSIAVPTDQYADNQTAAITARNAAINLPDESEALSSPTVVGDVPLQPNVHPGQHVKLDEVHWSPRESRSGSAMANDAGPHDLEEKHARFAPLQTDNLEDHGEFFSEGDHLTTSPVDGRESGRATPALKPILLDVRTASPAPHSAQLSPTNRPSFEEARRGVSPVPTNSRGETLPASAQTPSELERGASQGDGQISEPSQGRKGPLPPPGPQRMETELPEGIGSKRLFKMSKMFNAAGVLSETWATVEDSDDLDNFRPHVVHAPHDPFPIAMVCRKPHGLPGHHDIRNPQNAAWLAGFRYAKKKVFIQTPTLNARPIVRAIKQTCRRGVEVVLLLDLGFNDKGESIPFQGGTNEEVVVRLYKKLRKDKKEQHLTVYWYTGKDQVRPLNAVKKQRNCHIKFAAYDDEVLIIGNGNQDSQSWFHSQEVNVMIDSKQIIAEMMATLVSNQNTMQYGLVDTDGTWRDKEGKTLEDYGATDKGTFRGLSAFLMYAKSTRG